MEATGIFPGQRSHVNYDNTFASLAFGFAPRHEGKAGTVFQELTTPLVTLGSPRAELLPKRKPARNVTVGDVFALPEVDQLRKKLIDQATARGGDGRPLVTTPLSSA